MPGPDNALDGVNGTIIEHPGDTFRGSDLIVGLTRIVGLSGDRAVHETTGGKPSAGDAIACVKAGQPGRSAA